MVIILQLLLLEKYRGPDLGDLNGHAARDAKSKVKVKGASAHSKEKI